MSFCNMTLHCVCVHLICKPLTSPSLLSSDESIPRGRALLVVIGVANVISGLFNGPPIMISPESSSVSAVCYYCDVHVVSLSFCFQQFVHFVICKELHSVPSFLVTHLFRLVKCNILKVNLMVLYLSLSHNRASKPAPKLACPP
jgi:hypothetical protein